MRCNDQCGQDDEGAGCCDQGRNLQGRGGTHILLWSGHGIIVSGNDYLSDRRREVKWHTAIAAIAAGIGARGQRDEAMNVCVARGF